MTSRDEFERLFKDVLAGRISRRDVMTRGAGLGAGAALLGAGMTVAAPRGVLRAAAQDAAPKPGGVLRMGMQADPTALDPHKQSLTAIWHVVEHIYSRMTRIKDDLSVENELAESVDISADGLTYTFKLRPGVTFHNGRELVGEDVVYSYQRLVDPATASASAADLDSMDTIEAPDPTTVVMKLKAPDASLLSILGGQSCIIIPKEVVEENGDLSQVAVGSGPFVFKEYTPNTSVILEKNPTYFEEGLPYLDGVELLIAPEDNSRTTALISGTVDFIEYAPSKDIEIFENDDSIALTGNSITQIRMIGFNLRKEPFNNLLVRQAISKVVDRGPIIEAALFGRGTPAEVIFPQDYWAALPHEIAPPDVEGAKQLMAEAGFADGFQTTITSWAQYDFLKNAAIVVQEQLKQIGIEAELNLVENATMSDQVYINHEFDMAVTGDSAYTDPNTLILGNFKTGEAGNFAGYSNPKVDELIAQGIAETDQAARAETYKQIQQILLEDLPWVSLFIGQQYEAMKTYVKGYYHIPTGSNLAVKETWLDQ